LRRAGKREEPCRGVHRGEEEGGGGRVERVQEVGEHSELRRLRGDGTVAAS
jgi:hypothetical protein